jgi:hypothetical protein
MSIEAVEKREQMLELRAKVLQAEQERVRFFTHLYFL